jgi:hypothetical protein
MRRRKTWRAQRFGCSWLAPLDRIASMTPAAAQAVVIASSEALSRRRPPRQEGVWGNLDQVEWHNEWQGALVSTNVETDGPTRVVERRRVP